MAEYRWRESLELQQVIIVTAFYSKLGFFLFNYLFHFLYEITQINYISVNP